MGDLSLPKISVIIPALNEEASIAQVIHSVKDYVNEVIVCDNGSTDDTALNAKQAGAVVVSETVPGYGRACLAGVDAANTANVLVFMDGDAADNPQDLPKLIKPILDQEFDMVIGSRLSGVVEDGALTFPQKFGNWLACRLMKIIWKAPYTDLGPFRAIRKDGLTALNMDALTYGWTIQMQIRALKAGLKVTETPVNYSKRIGVSKISGTVKGVVLAGTYILSVIFIEATRDRHSRFVRSVTNNQSPPKGETTLS